MNRTLIEWTMYTWNVLVGCLLGCRYCYASRQARRRGGRCPKCYEFVPHLHPERLGRPTRVKIPSLIFVESMGELFGPWVPQEWIDLILGVVPQCPQHIFQFLTKCPAKLAEVVFAQNCWVGTSIDFRKNLWRKELLLKANAPVRFVSFEPLLEDMGDIDLNGVDWVIIGAQTGPKAVKPEPAWIERLINAARTADVPLFVKDNVDWPETVREWPKAFKDCDAVRNAMDKLRKRAARLTVAKKGHAR